MQRYIRISIALVTSFVFVNGVAPHVFLGASPLVRQDFIAQVKDAPHTLPQIVADYSTKLLARRPTAVPTPFDSSPSKILPTANPTTQSQPTTAQQPPTPTGFILPSKSPTALPSPTTKVNPPTVTPTTAQPNVDITILEQQTVDLINQKRKAENSNLQNLTINQYLVIAARGMSNDMVQHNACYKDHKGSDGSTFIDRINKAGFKGSAYGETLICAGNTPEIVVNGWWSSPPHHAVLTNDKIKQIGVGWAGSGGSTRVTADVAL